MIMDDDDIRTEEEIWYDGDDFTIESLEISFTIDNVAPEVGSWDYVTEDFIESIPQQCFECGHKIKNNMCQMHPKSTDTCYHCHIRKEHMV